MKARTKPNLNTAAVCIGLLMISSGLFMLFGWPIWLLFAGVFLIAWGGVTQ